MHFVYNVIEQIPLFALVKATAFIMMICMVFLSAFAGSVNAMQTSTVKSCCHKAAKDVPCNHNPKNDCSQGMCNTFTCNTCGFLKADLMRITPPVATVKKADAIPYYLGNLSAYSSPKWQPPKV
jgi:hypothetical protein